MKIAENTLGMQVWKWNAFYRVRWGEMPRSLHWSQKRKWKWSFSSVIRWENTRTNRTYKC